MATPAQKKNNAGRNALFLIVGLVVLGNVLAHTSGSSSSSASTSADTTTSAPAPSFEDAEATVTAARPTIRLSATTMAAQYDANKITSEAYYRGRTVQIMGRAQDVNQDILGSYYVALVPSDPNYVGFVSMQCYVSSPADVVSVVKGNSVTVRGTVADMSLGSIPFKNCTVVSTGA